ncbi:MAG: HemK2/MTQ2 family protein methyltransferase [archaeon]
MIYEPSEDSFLLQKYVLKYAKGKVLDMGTGSGLQALTALKKTKDVLAVDINKEAIKHVKEKGVKVIQSDLFSKVKGKFDLIIFNPPYLPEETLEDKESQLITTGGKKGYEVLEKFLVQAKKHLNENGQILIVFSSQGGDVKKIFKKLKYKFEVLEEKSLFFEKLTVYLLELK